MNEETYEENWYSVIPLAFLVLIVPLIVYGKVINLRGDYHKYWTSTAQSLDFFSYYKAIWVIILAVVILLILGIKMLCKNIEIQKTLIYIPMTAYSLLIFLSTIFSDHKEISIFGFVERYEGMIVLLAYMLILFASINLTNNEKSIKIILIALLCSAVVIGTIGIFQYFQQDIFRTNFGKRLILPEEYQSMVSRLKFKFGDKIIYSTLYHYNYVGSYMAMLFPMTVTIFILTKNKFYKIAIGIISLLMFLNLLLSNSRAGIIGGAGALLLLFIMLRKLFIARWRMSLLMLAVPIVAGVIFNIYSRGGLVKRLGSLVNDAGNIAKASSSVVLKDVVLKDNSLEIITQDDSLRVSSNAGRIQFKDSLDNIINSHINKETKQVILDNPKYKDYIISLKDNSITKDKRYDLEIHKSNVKMNFIINNDDFSYINNRGEAVELKPVEKWGFEGKEKLGSARAYIWSRSIPLLKNTLLLGYGPDTFIAKFPQYDYIGKLVAYGTTEMIVDKPHNLYLQNAINIGIPGLIAFLAMFVIYFANSIKVYYRNNFDDFYSVIGLSIFVAIYGYLGAGFFNDSVVSVAPVFWVLLGMGISINYKLGRPRKQNI